MDESTVTVALNATELELLMRGLHKLHISICDRDLALTKVKVRLGRRLAQARLEALGLPRTD